MFNANIAVFLCAMLPIVELRGAIPLGAALNVHPVLNFLISIVGNLLPVPFILLFINQVLKFLKRFKFTRRVVEWVERKLDKLVTKHKNITFWGLVFFVAIPLPGTGAWTGALLADFFKLGFWKSFLAIVIGVLIAGTIVSLIAYGALGFLNFLI